MSLLKFPTQLVVELGLKVLSPQAWQRLSWRCRGESGTLWVKVGGGVGKAPCEIMTSEKILFIVIGTGRNLQSYLNQLP